MSLFDLWAPLYRSLGSLPPLPRAARVPGLLREVEVLFTEGGIPHLYAHGEEDLFFAQGYLAASERMFLTFGYSP